jgi:hypothetical protein
MEMLRHEEFRDQKAGGVQAFAFLVDISEGLILVIRCLVS